MEFRCKDLYYKNKQFNNVDRHFVVKFDWFRCRIPQTVENLLFFQLTWRVDLHGELWSALCTVTVVGLGWITLDKLALFKTWFQLTDQKYLSKCKKFHFPLIASPKKGRDISVSMWKKSSGCVQSSVTKLCRRDCFWWKTTKYSARSGNWGEAERWQCSKDMVSDPRLHCTRKSCSHRVGVSTMWIFPYSTCVA